MLRTIKKITGLNRKEFLACLVSGFLLSLPFDSGRFWVFAWFGFVPVFLALANKSLRQAFVLFFVTGIIFWWLTIYWLVNVTFTGTAILVIYLALSFGAFGLLIRPFVKRSTVFTVLLVPAVWVLLEYARAHLLTGFPWALLGYSQYQNPHAIQIADITGSYGVSFLVMLVNAGIVEIIYSAREKLLPRLVRTAILLFFIVSAALFYGSLRLSAPAPEAAGSSVRVSVIQGNIPQELKWDPRAQAPIISKYLALSRDSLADHPDLIVWPEASFPEFVERAGSSFAKVTQFASTSKVSLLVGAVTCPGDAYYNSALLLSDAGTEAGRYNKVHLVPFGEYIPLKKIFPFLEAVVPIGDFDKGSEFTVFNLPADRKFSVLICFEDVFPGLSRRFVNEGADFLVNITNDAWYKKTSAAGQHLQASVFRAVENRRYLVRAANTGNSCFISPSGIILSQVSDKRGESQFVDGYLTCAIPPVKGSRTFYTRHGDLFIVFCLFICLWGAVGVRMRFKGKTNV